MQIKINEQVGLSRKRKGLTQEKIAELLDLSTEGYRNKERGANSFTVPELTKLADILGETFIIGGIK